MTVDWLRELTVSIAAMCANIAIVECLCGDDSLGSGLKLVCGAYVALSIIRMMADAIKIIL